MSTKLSTSLSSLFLAALLLPAAAPPAGASPPYSVDVDVDQIKPLQNDAFIYMTVQGDTQSDPPLGRLAIDLLLTNNEPAAVTLDRIVLDFDVPNLTSITLNSALMMRCSGGVGSVLSGAGNLILPAGDSCRVSLTPDPLLALPAPGRLRLFIYYTGIVFGTTVSERDLVSYDNTTATGSYRFPVRREDLAGDEFWSGRSGITGSHHRMEADGAAQVYAYDLGIARKDGGGVWRNYEAPLAGEVGAAVNDQLDDFMCWEEPVYAMADGIVQDCEGLQADNPAGQEGGNWNFFSILHGEEVVFYGHLKYDSVNWDLCAEDAEVAEGDFLGLIGNSGSSGGVPHLHIHAVRDGHPVPLQFNDGFSIERVTAFTNPPNGNAPWSAHRGYGLSPTPIALWPSPLRRRGQATDVGITEVALTNTSSARTVSASRTTAGNLKVTLWETDDDGEAVPLDDDTGGGVTKVALATPYGTADAALAMVTAGGSLKLVGYDVTASTIIRAGEATSIAALDVAVAPAAFAGGLVTAAITSVGDLRVTTWEADIAGDTMTQLDDINSASAPLEVAVVRTTTFPGVVVATRNTSNRLRLFSFEVASGGNLVTLEDDYQDALVDQISLSRLGTRSNGDDLLVTACVTDGGTLELVSWSVDAAGTITRLADAAGPTIAEVSVARASSRHVLTAVGNAGGDLDVIAWHVADDGSFTRRGDSEGGAATMIFQGDVKTGVVINTPHLATTAMVDSNGDLRLIVHQVQLTD